MDEFTHMSTQGQPSSAHFYFGSSKEIGVSLFEDYGIHAKVLRPKVVEDRKLGEFVCYDNRLHVSLAMRIDLANVTKMRRQDTLDCYVLMLKIADLWFSFEHLLSISKPLFPRKANSLTVDPYDAEVQVALGFTPITANFNSLLRMHVLHSARSRLEVYSFLSYLTNNTERGTKSTISQIHDLVETSSDLEAKHALSLAYGLRNVYAHKGVAAALGSKNYRVKKYLYLVLYDTIILYSLALGSSFCRKKLEQYPQTSVCDQTEGR